MVAVVFRALRRCIYSALDPAAANIAFGLFGVFLRRRLFPEVLRAGFLELFERAFRQISQAARMIGIVSSDLGDGFPEHASSLSDVK